MGSKKVLAGLPVDLGGIQETVNQALEEHEKRETCWRKGIEAGLLLPFLFIQQEEGKLADWHFVDLPKSPKEAPQNILAVFAKRTAGEILIVDQGELYQLEKEEKEERDRPPLEGFVASPVSGSIYNMAKSKVAILCNVPIGEITNPFEVAMHLYIAPLTIDKDHQTVYFPVYLEIKAEVDVKTFTQAGQEAFWRCLRANVGELSQTFKRGEEPPLTTKNSQPKPELIKAGMHLEGQKLGGHKEKGRQLNIDDILYRIEAPAEEKNKITVVGVDLTQAEQKALFAIQTLLSKTDYQGNIPGEKKDGKNPFNFSGYLPGLEFTPAEFLEAYGVGKYESSRGKMEYSRAERGHALKALANLATKPFLINYRRQYYDEKGQEKYSLTQTVKPLIEIQGYFNDLLRGEVEALETGQAIPGAADKLRKITIYPSPLIVDQVNNYFVLKPANLIQEIAIKLPNAKREKFVYAFIENYLFYEAENIRRKVEKGERGPEAWTLKINYIELAKKLRMDSWINNRKWKQIRSSLNKCYKVAKELGYITDYKTKQGSTKEIEEITLNPEKFIRKEAKEESLQLEEKGKNTW